jgi:phosphoglucosamine mutase
MRAHGLNVGGEQSGHVVLSDYLDHRRRPGLGAAGAGLHQAGQPARQRGVRRFEPVPQLLRNVKFSGGSPLDRSRSRRRSRMAQACWAKLGPLVIRPSGTEPLIRVMAEADDDAGWSKRSSTTSSR